MKSELSVTEAKARFAEAMADMSLSSIVKSSPIESAGVAAAAGALFAFSGRRLSRMFFPALSLAELLLKLISGKD